MAHRKRGTLEGEDEVAFYKPCQHLLDFKANKGAKAFKQLQSAGIFTRNGSKQVLQCALCKRTCDRLYTCLVCASVGCWDSSSPDLSHALAHTHLYPDHNLAIDLHRAELFCCICADQVYDSDFDYVVICSQLPLFKPRPKRILNGMHVELPNTRETRSKKKKKQQDCHFAKTPCQQAILSKHAPQVNGDDSSVRAGLRGMNNLGNTCFMNCILQALIHIRPLQNFFLNGCHNRNACQDKGSHSCLGCEMHTIYSAAFSGDYSPYSPAQFLYSWWQHAANLAGYKQQDAHEFFISAIDGFHATLANVVKAAKSKNAGDADCKCIAHRVFSGLLRSDVSCTVCGFSSTAHDPCIDISLDLEPPSAHVDTNHSNGCGVRSSRGAQTAANANANGGTTLYACLDRFTRLERLGFGEKFYCQNCKVPQDSVKQMSVKKLPLVLCLHIKRFEHSSFSNVSRKLDRYVQFPFSLNMTPFLSPSVVRLRHGNRLVAEEHDECESNLAEFELLAVVTHTGKLDSGHYITYLQLGGLWYRCDDSWVSKASEDAVRACQAYMLFYVQKNQAIDE